MAKQREDIVLTVTIKNGREVHIEGNGLEGLTNYAMQSIVRNMRREIRKARARMLQESRRKERQARDSEEQGHKGLPQESEQVQESNEELNDLLGPPDTPTDSVEDALNAVADAVEAEEHKEPEAKPDKAKVVIKLKK